jgi:hypothetical protein
MMYGKRVSMQSMSCKHGSNNLFFIPLGNSNNLFFIPLGNSNNLFFIPLGNRIEEPVDDPVLANVCSVLCSELVCYSVG